MIPFPKFSDSKAAPLCSAAFFIWSYRFYEDRIEIDRNFILSRSTVISMDKIEMLMAETDPILSAFGRCNLMLTFAGNVFTLFGLPISIADRLMEQLSESESADGHAIRISTKDLLKKSALSTKLIWYLLLLVMIWSAVFLMGSDFIDSEKANALADFVFRHLLVAGTLVLSLGLPTVLIWLWAFTGGFLIEFLKYYRYTATRRGDLLYFEYGLLIHRRIYLDARRIAIVEFKQPPMMRLFGYGQLRVRAVGHNPLFLKAKILLPFIKASALSNAMLLLFPAVEQKPHPPCRRSLYYDFFSLKYLLPLACLVGALFFGWPWVIAAAFLLLGVTASVLLEYKNAYFCLQDIGGKLPLVILSMGGFYRTCAWIDMERVEMLAISGSRRKLRKGYANIRVRVFGKSGPYALVRNICTDDVSDDLTS